VKRATGRGVEGDRGCRGLHRPSAPLAANILHDEITSIDHTLTRPWTVDKRYVHNPDPRPDWVEFYNTENNAQIAIGKENYFVSGDGLLMPAKKDHAPPDLRYFKQTRK
jgi:hypothetical protein